MNHGNDPRNRTTSAPTVRPGQVSDPAADSGARSLGDKTVVTVIHTLRPTTTSTKQACLVVIYGQELGKKFNLEGSSYIIGRSSKCDIQIDQESVSRNHAKVINSGKSVIIRDLGSTNGTYVNDQAIDERVLRDGDLIKIGRTIFKFLSGDNIENQYHEEIYRLTTMDGLTQVYNKRYLMESLDREISRARRYQRPLSILMFDIDHFKRINDTYGHLAGDYVLKEMASIIKSRIRREDLIGRYGGEEFIIILPEIDHPNAMVIAEKIRCLVERHRFSYEGVPIEVTISVGVATAWPGLGGPEEFIKRADENLYAAKNSGRNRCVGDI